MAALLYWTLGAAGLALAIAAQAIVITAAAWALDEQYPSL